MSNFYSKFSWVMGVFLSLCPFFVIAETTEEDGDEITFQKTSQSFTTLRSGMSEEKTSDGKTYINSFGRMYYGPRWGNNNVFETDILIDRYYGTQEQIHKQIQRGLMDSEVTLVIPTLDCDITYDGSSVIAPEYDHIYFNGHYVDQVIGDNDTTFTIEYKIPISYVKFPKRPGEIAKNHIVIDIDTANKNGDDATYVWVLGVYYQKLTIEAVPPIVLVHGWTENSEAMIHLKEHIEDNYGIPCEMPDVAFNDAPASNGEFLAGFIEDMLDDYHSTKVNIIAHSKGGLDSRYLIDQNGCNFKYVQSLLQISTPNAGSNLADLLLAPEGFWKNVIVDVYSYFNSEESADTPALRALTPGEAAQFNATYANPNAAIHTVIGRLGNHWLTNYYSWLGWLCYNHDDTSADSSRHGDGIVAVDSAHALGTAIMASPLRENAEGTDTDHSEIICGGAPRVFSTLYNYVRKPLEGDLEKRVLSYNTRGLLASTNNLRSADSSQTEEKSSSAGEESRAISKQKEDLKAELPRVLFSSGVQRISQVVPGGTITDVEVPLLGISPDGEIFSFFGLPDDSKFTLLGPDGVELSDLLITKGKFFGRDMMMCKLPAGSVDGVYHLRCEVPGEKTTGYPLCINVSAYETVEIAVYNAVDYNEPARSVQIRAKLLCADNITSTTTPEFTLILEALNDDGTRDSEAEEITVVMSEAEDGWYEAEVTPERLGNYNAQVRMDGEFNNVKQTRYASVRARVTDVTVQQYDIKVASLSFNYDKDECKCLCTAISALCNISFRCNGEYIISADLYSPSGVKCGTAFARATMELCGGGSAVSTPVTLTFSGDKIYATGESGVYTMRNITVCGDSDDIKHLRLFRSDEQYQTAELRYEAFAPAVVCVSGLVKDYKEGLTNEETPAYQYLSAEFKVMVAPGCGGAYGVVARLINKNNKAICYANAVKVELKDCIEAEGEQIVKLQFDGTKIREFGEDGPYYIDSLRFERQEKPNGEDVDLEVKFSKAEPKYRLRGKYKYCDFTFNLIEVENTLCRWSNVEILEKNNESGEYTVRLTCKYDLPEQMSDISSGIYAFLSYELSPIDGITGMDRAELMAWMNDVEKFYVAIGVYMYDCFLFPPIKAKYDTMLDNGITVLTSDEEISSQITTQLPTIGNHDDVLDIGETFYVELKVKCEPEFEFAKWTPMVTLTGKAMIPFYRNFTPLAGLTICHVTDTNSDYEIDLDEATIAIEEWHSDVLDNTVLLEALELSGVDKYHYDKTSNRFRPGRELSMRNLMN